MQGRLQRFMLPGAVVIASFFINLFFATGFQDPFDYLSRFFPSLITFPSPILPFILGVGVSGLVLGSFCNIFFSMIMFRSVKERLVDFDLFMEAFGIRVTKWPIIRKEIYKKLYDPLLGEFHVRLHSHAPPTFIDFCSRRNTAWYIAKNSSIAYGMGFILAIIILLVKHIPPNWEVLANVICLRQIIGFIFSLVSASVFFGLSWHLGTKWNTEFWQAAWKWIMWDIEKHPYPKAWLEFLNRKILQGIGEVEPINQDRYLDC